jgi:hypothetical protein
MWKIIFLLLIIDFFPGLSSCICTKKYCEGFEELNAYKLTDFVTRKEESNCPGDNYNVLDSYSVNGQKQSASAVSLVK